MKFIKIDLLTLLISLFLFASCKSSNTIGLDIDPGTEIVGTLADSVTVLTRTITDDPISTWSATSAEENLIRHPFGYLTDPALGTSEASLAMGVTLPSAAYRFGTNAVLDSAVLVLPYATQFYGDTTTSVYSVDVHQLQSDITTASSFTSTQEWPYETPLAGNYTGRIKPTTPLRITTIVAGAADTLRAVPAQLRVRLSNAFIQANLLNLDTVNFRNNPTFASEFKGLHVSINKASSTGTGGIMFFNFTNDNSRIELYFKRQNATTATITDTVTANFPVNYSATNPVAATIKHNYSTEVTAQLQDVTNNQYPVTFLQGLGGLRNKISFPYLKEFYDKFGVRSGPKVIINKAELVVDLSSGTDVAPFIAAPRLSLYRYDIAGRRTNLPDNPQSNQTNQPNSFGGIYDPVGKKYTFLVTSYLQDLLDGKTQDYGTYLSTSASSEFNLTTPITSSARSIIGSFPNPANKTRLNVYYTVVN